MADYCTDGFKMVEDTDDSFRMWQGLVGPYYVPIMSNDGTLRWTNNGGLPNPQEVNLMGPQGAGIRIAGIRESAEELPATAPAGDIWLVGEGSPYEGYSFTGGEWLDLGPLTVGPAGPPGPQGDDYDLTEADKQEIAEISEGLFLAELDNDPLAIRYGGTDAHDLAEAKENLGISDIEDKLGSWPLGTDAQDVAAAINEMIGVISLQVADIAQLKANFAGEFSPTNTYAVGAYVVYDGAFWRCTTAVTTAGNWTGASNWTQVTAGGEFEALATLIASAQAALEALSTAINGKVSKAGDTMTGNLTIDTGARIRAKANFKSNGTYSATKYADQILMLDTEGNNIGYFRSVYYPGGNEALDIIQQRNLNGSNVFNSMQLAITPAGTKVITLSDPAAWRSALGLTYAANDTFSINSSIVATGFINSNSTTFWLDYSVDKSMENISTVSVTAMKGYTMGVSGGLDGTTSEKAYTASPYTISAIKQGNHHVRIGITKSSAFTNTTPLTPITYFGTLTLKFT